jgi:hypothetical protein
LLRTVQYGAAQFRDKLEEAIANVIERAGGGIKIVQADGTTNDFEQVRAALNDGERVVFLGFSFGRANVDRLNLSCVNDSAQIICSRYQVRDAEVQVQIFEPFNKATRQQPAVTQIEDDCLDLLRSHIDKLVSRY